MKTVRTITCHDVYNVGAGLQAYALVTYLKGQGYDAQILDYKPEYLTRHYRLNVVSNPRFDKPVVRQLYLLAKLPGRLKALKSRKKQEFDAFRRQYLPVTERSFSSNEELRASSPAADAYIAGSDQIWNPLFPNGKDPAFYLDFVREGKKISYAASFAVQELPQEMREIVHQRLSSFDAISVREASGARILDRLGIPGVQVCDPVFLLAQSAWLELIGGSPNAEDDIFVYDFDDSPLIAQIVHQIKAEKKLPALSYFSRSYADRTDESGPVQFLRNIAASTVVLSNSFHATAFSLILHKEFFVVGRKEAINTRMVDLLSELGLSDRYLVEPNDWKKALPIDWKQVDLLMNRQITRSKTFLREALEK